MKKLLPLFLVLLLFAASFVMVFTSCDEETVDAGKTVKQ